MNLLTIERLLRNSVLECVTRGVDLSPSKTHLLVYHPQTVDRQTDLDLRTSKRITKRLQLFYISVPHCFLAFYRKPVGFLRAMRPWIIPADAAPKVLERINALNKETSLQKIVLSDGLFFDGEDPTPHYRGWVTLTTPVPEMGFTTSDIEIIVTRLMAVPVESILQKPAALPRASRRVKIDVPPFLGDVVSREAYVRWLNRKAQAHVKRDTKHHPNLTVSAYKALIHEAVVKSNGLDAYTGEMLDWSLLSTWRNRDAKEQGAAYKQKFALLPTVDHLSDRRDAAAFSICSLRTNSAKSDLSTEDFLSLCKRVTAYLG